MSKKKENIPKSERSEIVNNILGAKDRREQLKIEADLHLTSVTVIKEILKDYGVNLKIFNGNRKKKHIEDEFNEEQEIITPVENIEAVEEQATQEPDPKAENFLSEVPLVKCNASADDIIGKVKCESSKDRNEFYITTATGKEFLRKRLDETAECIKSSTPEETAADSIDIDLSYQRFKALIREKMHCEDRLEEIKAELQLYRDTCNCILLDLKEGGIEA